VGPLPNSIRAAHVNVQTAGVTGIELITARRIDIGLPADATSDFPCFSTTGAAKNLPPETLTTPQVIETLRKLLKCHRLPAVRKIHDAAIRNVIKENLLKLCS